MGCDCLCSSSHYSPCENEKVELGLELHPTPLVGYSKQFGYN